MNEAAEKDVQKALQLRMEAKEKENEVKELKKRADKIFSDLMDQYGIDKAEHPEYGKYSRVETSRYSLDNEKLKLELIKSGMTVDKVNEIFDICSTKRTSVSFRYSYPKK